MAEKSGLTKGQQDAVFRKTAILIKKQNPSISMEEAKKRAAKTMGPGFKVPERAVRGVGLSKFRQEMMKAFGKPRGR